MSSLGVEGEKKEVFIKRGSRLVQSPEERGWLMV